MKGHDDKRGARHRPTVTRRDLLKTAGAAAGAWAASGVGEARQEDAPQSLTRSEYDTLDAIAARIIPSDSNGPGAREAEAVRFIDRGLAGALRDSLDRYRSGLAALDAYARATRGDGFARLSEADQDAVLAGIQDDVQGSRAPGFIPNPAQFFNMVRGHTIQGTFSDPFYGGNANFVGWDMIGYPGVRTAVPPGYQQIGSDHPPNHTSVYDFTMFDEGAI